MRSNRQKPVSTLLAVSGRAPGSSCPGIIAALLSLVLAAGVPVQVGAQVADKGGAPTHDPLTGEPLPADRSPGLEKGTLRSFYASYGRGNKLSDQVAVVTGTIRRPVGATGRIEVARELPGDLAALDQEALAAFGALDGVPRPFKPSDWRLVFNSIANALGRQQVTQIDLLDWLRGCAGNAGADPVVREYAVQHVGSKFSEFSPEARREAVDFLETTLAEKGALRPVALLAAVGLVEGGQAAGAADEFESLAAACRVASGELAGDPGGAPSARIAGFQAAGVLGWDGAARGAESALGDEDVPAGVKRAAVGYLGKVGNAAHFGVIGQAGQNDPDLGSAVSTATKLIRDRDSQDQR